MAWSNNNEIKTIISQKKAAMNWDSFFISKIELKINSWKEQILRVITDTAIKAGETLNLSKTQILERVEK